MIKNCLVCGKNNLKSYLNLGNQPLANNLSSKINVKKYPLKIVYCKNCYHNQLTFEVNKEKLFSKYFYLSSQSKSLQNHFNNAAKKYIKTLNLNKNSCIIDIGSNDGIGLKYYQQKGYLNIKGVEPAKNIAKIANNKQIPTINSFLNFQLANKLSKTADLITASNVFAHNKNIKYLAKCLAKMLKDDGILIIEVQYLISMIENNLFDNIYHEHIHYWSANALNYLFNTVNCTIVNIEKIDTHGGSIRCYVKKKKLNQNLKVKNFLKKEIKFGIKKKRTYHDFQKRLQTKKNNFKFFLKKNYNREIIGYGAAAKTATLLNYLNISNDIKLIIDDNKLKHNKYIPGTKIKITSKYDVKKKIDILIIFAWNYFTEIKNKIDYANKIISIRDFFK